MNSSMRMVLNLNRRWLGEALRAMGEAAVVVVSVGLICVLVGAFFWLCLICGVAPHEMILDALIVFAVGSGVISLSIYLLLLAAFHYGGGLQNRWAEWRADCVNADELDAMILMRVGPLKTGAPS